MKKRTIAIASALCATLAVTTALAGCTGDHYNSIKFPADQDTSYAVTSQGGSVVAYGNYLYFINGTRGYDDADGDANVWDKVVKGALYRTELNGHDLSNGTYKTFVPERDGKTGLEFVSQPDFDYFDEPIDVVKSEKIAPKTIGTSGYGNGGIFIYDNYVYFATPVNMKNSTGTVQTMRTDYFMVSLNSGKATKIYTSSEGVDTSSSEYAFYKFKDRVYLVVNEVTDGLGTIVSVEIDTKKGKVADPTRFENINATSVYFPVRDTYYKGIDNNTVEDFIYFVRDVDKDVDETVRAGSVIEAMRPDGSENFIAVSSGKTATIEAVRDGLLFYRTTDLLGNSVIEYNSLHTALVEHSPTYKAKHEADGKQISSLGNDRSPMIVSSNVTATYAFRPDLESNEVFFIGVTGSTVRLYNTDGSFVTLCDSTGTPQFINGNYLYCAGTGTEFFRVPLWSNIPGYGEAQQLASDVTLAGISCDYAAGYFTYFAEVDQWANGYTYFYKLDDLEGEEPKFVGTRADFDIPTEEQIKEAKGETDED